MSRDDGSLTWLDRLALRIVGRLDWIEELEERERELIDAELGIANRERVAEWTVKDAAERVGVARQRAAEAKHRSRGRKR